MKKIKLTIMILLVNLFPLFAFAETIILKSGQKIEGKITEKTDKYINIDVVGVDVPYFYEDIESIDGKAIFQSSTKEGSSLSNVTKKNASDEESDFSSVTKLLYQGEFDQAINQYAKILQKDNLNIGVHHNLACAYALKENYDQALKEFNNALELEESSFQAIILFDRAVIYFKKKMYKEGVADLDQAVKLIPGMGKHENFFNLGTLNMAIGQYNAEFEKTIFSYDETSPELPDTVYFTSHILNLGRVHSYVFDDLNPPPLFFYQSPFAYVFLGTSFIKQENYSEAEAQFKAALDIKSQNSLLDNLPTSVANFYLGEFRLLDKNYPEAINYLKKAVALVPRSPSYYKYLSTAYFLNMDYLEAKDACQSALNLDPNDEEAQGLLNKINKELSTSDNITNKAASNE